MKKPYRERLIATMRSIDREIELQRKLNRSAWWRYIVLLLVVVMAYAFLRSNIERARVRRMLDADRNYRNTPAVSDSDRARR